MQFLGYKFGLKGSTYTRENTVNPFSPERNLAHAEAIYMLICPSMTKIVFHSTLLFSLFLCSCFLIRSCHVVGIFFDDHAATLSYIPNLSNKIFTFKILVKVFCFIVCAFSLIMLVTTQSLEIKVHLHVHNVKI